MSGRGGEEAILTLGARLDKPASDSAGVSDEEPASSALRIYTVRLRCQTIDVTVTPAVLRVTVPENTQTKQTVQIEKGELLFHREVRYSVEFVPVLTGAALEGSDDTNEAQSAASGKHSNSRRQLDAQEFYDYIVNGVDPPPGLSPVRFLW